MEVWVADVFDYSGETPFLVGVYETEEQAWAAIQIVIDRIVEKNPQTNVDARFVRYVTPVQMNGFTPAMHGLVLQWLNQRKKHTC